MSRHDLKISKSLDIMEEEHNVRPLACPTNFQGCWMKIASF